MRMLVYGRGARDWTAQTSAPWNVIILEFVFEAGEFMFQAGSDTRAVVGRKKAVPKAITRHVFELRV